MAIARIKPIPVVYKPGERTMQNAYAERGWMRNPGTGVGFPPKKLQSGKYATGLDDKSDEILQLIRLNPEEGNRKAEQVRKTRERLEAATGLDLNPRSEYYSGVFGIKMGTDEVATKMKLVDKENVFNLSIPQEEIKFLWVTAGYPEHIASSLSDYQAGRAKNSVQFYVENEAAEAEIVYSKNKSVADAVQVMAKMGPDTQRKVAKLCGLLIGENENNMTVYNKLYELINEGLVKNARYKGQDSVSLFTRIASLSTPAMDARFLIDQAIELRIYNKRNGVMYEGENMISATEEQLIDELSSGARQQEMLALEIKVNDKRKLRGNIEGISSYVAPAPIYSAPVIQQEVVAVPKVEIPVKAQETAIVPEVTVKPKTDNLAKARAARIEKKKRQSAADDILNA